MTRAKLEQLVTKWREERADEAEAAVREHYGGIGCTPEYIANVRASARSRHADELAEALALVFGPPLPTKQYGVDEHYCETCHTATWCARFRLCCAESTAAVLGPQPEAQETAPLPDRRCDCGAELTICANCAVAEWQGAHQNCHACCPPAALGHAG